MTLTLQLINFMFYMQNLERKSLIYVTRTCMHIVYCLSLSPLLLDLDRHLDGQAQINVNALCKVQWHHALFALFFRERALARISLRGKQITDKT